jgi:hypothetical protein
MHPPQLSGSKDGVAIIATHFGLPRNFCHGLKEAASAARETNRGESLWNLANGCKPLELGEWHVPEVVVPINSAWLLGVMTEYSSFSSRGGEGSNMRAL